MDSGTDILFQRLDEAIINLKEDMALSTVSELLRLKADPKQILDSFSSGLVEIGRLYEIQEYYMASLVLGGDLLRQALQILLPHLLSDETSTEKNRVVLIGTIEGDIHDLGKNTAGHFLKANGFDVIDLGVDVAPKTFLQEALKHSPDFIGVSLLLTTCVPALKRLSHLIDETYQGQLDKPVLFAACGFLRHQQTDLIECRRKSREWFGVDHVVVSIKETVQFCNDYQPRPSLKTAYNH